ncbi:hypothetical protein [Yoonia sp. BS5-3]|uniref:Sulfotransferase family protein n=1 Tax=Yoonia phaeophyticola TaxID=3137369 RepID=A0ABZ2V1Y1_9RHOB
MKAGELLLHIGHPKTGSTTLQEIWRANHNVLRGQGVMLPLTYPGGGRAAAIAASLFGARAHGGANMQWLQTDLAGLIERGHADWNRICEEVANDPPKTLLLSNEMLFRPMTGAKWQEVGQVLDQVAEHKRLVAYLRAPDAMFLSSAQEILKHVQTPGRFSRTQFKDTLVPLMKNWKGQIKLEQFDRQIMKDGDIYTDFMTKHLPFVDMDQLDRGPAELNTSLSAEAMAVLYDLVMEHFPWHHNRRLLAQYVARLDQKLENPTKPKLRPDAVQAVINWRGPDLFWLRDAFGITFPSIDYDAINPDEIDSNVVQICRIEDICAVNGDRKEELKNRAMRRSRMPRALRRWLAKY